MYLKTCSGSPQLTSELHFYPEGMEGYCWQVRKIIFDKNHNKLKQNIYNRIFSCYYDIQSFQMLKPFLVIIVFVKYEML